MKLLYYFIILFILPVKLAFSNISTNFNQCNPTFESILEGFNECLGTKCKKVWVHVVDFNLLSKQDKNVIITNLNQFKVEFRARVEFARMLKTNVINKNNVIIETIDTDPFKILFKKKFFV